MNSTCAPSPTWTGHNDPAPLSWPMTPPLQCSVSSLLLLLLSLILVFLMSLLPSLVLLTSFLPQTLPNSPPSHRPQMSLRPLCYRTCLHFPYTFKYVQIYIYIQTHTHMCHVFHMPYLLYLAWQVIQKRQEEWHIWLEINQVLLRAECLKWLSLSGITCQI